MSDVEDLDIPNINLKSMRFGMGGQQQQGEGEEEEETEEEKRAQFEQAMGKLFAEETGKFESHFVEADGVRAKQEQGPRRKH